MITLIFHTSDRMPLEPLVLVPILQFFRRIVQDEEVGKSSVARAVGGGGRPKGGILPVCHILATGRISVEACLIIACLDMADRTRG